MIAPLRLPPGFLKVGTLYESRGRWTDGNLVRWHDGVLQPVGGWQAYEGSGGQVQITLTTDVPRSSFTWTRNAGDAFLAIGTNAKLWTMSRSGTLVDATPAGFSAGAAEAGIEAGYGTGLYGDQVYGAPRVTYSNPVTAAAASWSFTTWGQDLIACLRGANSLYQWSGSGAATAVSNAPSAPSCCLTTAQRILMVGKSRTVYWSDAEDNTIWTSTATNQAGSQLLEGDGEIVDMVRVRDEVLILTTTDAWVARYIGPPFIFGFERVGSRCGCVAPMTLTGVDGLAAWLGYEQFYVYDGSVRRIPCEVMDFLRGDIKRSQISTAYGVSNTAYNEIWWFYRSESADDINKYVAWNYRDNFWMTGTLARNTMVDSGGLSAVLGVDAEGYVWSHEKIGVQPDATVYITSGPLETQNGELITQVRQLWPDEKALGSVNFTFLGRQGPNATEYTYGPYTSRMPTPTRAYGRQLQLKVTEVNSGWRLGTIRADVNGRGAR